MKLDNFKHKLAHHFYAACPDRPLESGKDGHSIEVLSLF